VNLTEGGVEFEKKEVEEGEEKNQKGNFNLITRGEKLPGKKHLPKTQPKQKSKNLREAE